MNERNIYMHIKKTYGLAGKNLILQFSELSFIF